MTDSTELEVDSVNEDGAPLYGLKPNAFPQAGGASFSAPSRTSLDAGDYSCSRYTTYDPTRCD